MNYFEKEIGKNGAHAKYYLQEVIPEIDGNRRFPTIIICPGGGYMYTSQREAEMIAFEFLAKGFHTIVLNYSTEGGLAYQLPIEQFPQNPISQFPNPLIELAEVVSSVYENSQEWSVNKDYIIVAGFSAGGNLAAQLGVHWHEQWLSEIVNKPTTQLRPTHLMLAYPALEMTNESERLNVMLYAMTGKTKVSPEDLHKINPINHVSKHTPPSFVWHTKEDQTVPVMDSIRFVSTLEALKIDYELHLFNKGKHGLSLANALTGKQSNNSDAQVSKWVELFLEWIYPYKTQQGRFFELEETE